MSVHLAVSTQTVQSLSSLSGLQELDVRDNPLQCDGDAACATRRQFRRWLNDTVDRLTLLRHPDDNAMTATLVRHSDDSDIAMRLPRHPDDNAMSATLVRHSADGDIAMRLPRHPDDNAMTATLVRHSDDGDIATRTRLPRHPDDAVDEYLCQDSGASYVSGRLDCDNTPLTLTAEQSAAHHGSVHQYTGVQQYTGVILVSISAVTVLVVATLILVLGLFVGRRYWRRSDVDYCKRRQSQLLQHDHHHHDHQDVHQLDADAGATSSRLQTLVATWLRRCWSSHTSLSSVGYRQVIGAELDVTSSSGDVTAMTSSGHDLAAS